MLTCDWEHKKGLCRNSAPWTVQLKGSFSAANVMVFCFTHVKKYRSRKFVESIWGPGARVEIRRDVKPKRKFLMMMRQSQYDQVKAKTPLVQDGIRLACALFVSRQKTDKPHRIDVVEV